MTSTQASRRTVFRTIAQTTYSERPDFDLTPLYDQSSIDGLEADIQTVVAAWFDHDAHKSVEECVCNYPLSYVDFWPPDEYSSATRYEMSQLFQVFLLEELHGWNHETALIEYLECRPALCEQLDLTERGHVRANRLPSGTPFEAEIPRHHAQLFSSDDGDFTAVVPAVTCPPLTALRVLNASGAAATMAMMNIPATICGIPIAVATFSVPRTAAYAPTMIATRPPVAKPISSRPRCTSSLCSRPR